MQEQKGRPELHPTQDRRQLELTTGQGDICPLAWSKSQAVLWGCSALHLINSQRSAYIGPAPDFLMQISLMAHLRPHWADASNMHQPKAVLWLCPNSDEIYRKNSIFGGAAVLCPISVAGGGGDRLPWLYSHGGFLSSSTIIRKPPLQKQSSILLSQVCQHLLILSCLMGLAPFEASALIFSSVLTTATAFSVQFLLSCLRLEH